MEPNPVRYEEVKYPIRDIDGNVQAVHVKRIFPDEITESGKPDKTFYWSELDGKSTRDLPLYATERLTTVEAGSDIFLVEGETACRALWSRGFPSVATVCGAASVHHESALEVLKPYHVYLWPDNDDIGRKHMQKHREILQRLGIVTGLVNWKDAPSKGDAADLIDTQNGTAHTIIETFLAEAEKVEPPKPEGLIIRSGKELAGLYVHRLNELHHARASGRLPYIPTGFDQLDYFFGGGLRPQLYSLHAQTGIGKSTYVLQLALQSHTPTLFVSTETPSDEIAVRIATQLTRLPRRDLLSGNLSPEEEAKVATRVLNATDFLHVVEPTAKDPVTRQEIEDIMVKLKAESDTGHAILIIDSVHSWILGLAAGDSDYDERKIIDMVLMKLDEMWKELQIPIIIITERDKSSMSRAVNDRGNNAQAGSRRLSYLPGQILSMDEKSPDEDFIPGKPKEISLRIGKSKLGPQNVRIEMLFDRDTMTFSEVY